MELADQGRVFPVGFMPSKLWDRRSPLRSLPNLRRVDFDVFAVGSHSLALLVSP
jgi:hypothetical protein